MKVKAVYREPKANPFRPRPSHPVVRAEVPDDTPTAEIIKMAKEATPQGMEFVRVEDEKGVPLEE